MRNLLEIIIGFSAFGLIAYTLVISILILTGNTDKTFNDISIQLILSLILVGNFVYHYIKENKNPPPETTAISKAKAKKQSYDPAIDVLSFAHYQQKSETRWSDSDGDIHSMETEYASLRFYEDGTVIGKRAIAILKVEIKDSFVYKGTWNVSENKIELHLNKVKDVNDTIFKNISAEEERNMKYAGHITTDDEIIKEGVYSGTIKGNTIEIGTMVFSKITPDRLIITATQNECDSLESEFKKHPLVTGSFRNSGNWYSNGEEGPEWHTITFESRYELREKLENDLKKSTAAYSNMYWG